MAKHSICQRCGVKTNKIAIIRTLRVCQTCFNGLSRDNKHSNLKGSVIKKDFKIRNKKEVKNWSVRNEFSYIL